MKEKYFLGRMIQKIFGVFLVLAMVMIFVPINSMTVYADSATCRIGTTNYVTLQDAFDAAKDNETIELLSDITLKAQTTLTGNKRVTLDGKDYTINGGGNENGLAVDNANLTMTHVTYDGKDLQYSTFLKLDNKGELTINAGVSIKNADINTSEHSIIRLNSTSKIVMNDGSTITNIYGHRGVIRLDSGSSFTMNGGEITNCKTKNDSATKYQTQLEAVLFYLGAGASGDLDTTNPASFIMNGGTISGCSDETAKSRGLIFMHPSCCGKVELNGGEIKNNTADYGGVVYSVPNTGVAQTINISGTIIANENKGTKLGTDAQSNVYLGSGEAMSITGKITGDALVGVRTQNAPTATEDIQIATYNSTYEGGYKDISHFVSDDGTSGIVYCDGNNDYDSEGHLVTSAHSTHAKGLWLSKEVTVIKARVSTNDGTSWNNYTDIDQAFNAATNAGTSENPAILRLESDWVGVAKGFNSYVIIDLNGHIITNEKSDGTHASHYYATRLFRITSGVLTIRDTSEEKTGALINAADSEQGGGIYIPSGTLILESGTIRDNSMGASGGVGIGNSGSFYMRGGKITGNTATYGGGNATGRGGGVQVWGSGAIFEMTGGEIIANSATIQGDGVSFEGSNSRMFVGGSAKISGNTGNNNQNLYLSNGKLISVSETNPLADDSSISVTTQTTPTIGNPVQITSEGNCDNSSYFSSDNENYKIYNKTDANNKQYLVLSVHEHNWTYKAEGNVLKAYCTEEFGNSNCDHNGEENAASITLSASSPTYSGSAIAKNDLFSEVSFTEFNEATGNSLSVNDIKLFAAADTSKSTALTEITEAGSYLAELTFEGKTATCNVTVKAIPASGDFTYTEPRTLTTGEPRSATVVPASGITGMGEITVYYSSDNGSSWTSTAPSTAGTYKVAIDVAEGSSYAAGEKITADAWTFTLYNEIADTIAVTDIDAPVKGINLDTEGACEQTGVATTAPAVTWKDGETEKAGEAAASTAYTAYITLEASSDYKFAENPSVTINGNTATVTRTDDTHITASYTFDATAPMTYVITKEDTENGSFEVKAGSSEASSAEENTEITIIPTADASYEVDKVYWKKASASAYTEIANDSGYKFAMPSEDVSVKVTFKVSSVTVSFNANGGSGKMADVKVAFGNYTLPSCTFTAPSGKEFDGWATSAKGTKISNTTYNVTEDITFYALWKDTAKKDTPAAENKSAKKIALDSKFSVTSGKSVKVTWGKVSDADGYDIYMTYCSKDKPKIVKTVKSVNTTKATISKLNKKSINQKKNIKCYVIAYKMVNGKKQTLAKTIDGHAVGRKNTFATDAKGIALTKSTYTISKGKTATIKAKTIKKYSKRHILSRSHAAEFRYATSDTKVATVSKSGKITAQGKGSCAIYVYAVNGLAKKIKVTVK